MLEGLKPVKKVRPCRIRTIMAELDDKDQKILQDALTSDEFTPYTLSKALSERGVMVDHKIIARHIDNLCTCRDL